MADGFKIADAFVEVTAHTDKVDESVQRSVRNLPSTAGRDADKAGSGIGSRIAEGLFRGMNNAAQSGGLMSSVLGTMAIKMGVFATAGLGAIAVLQQLAGVAGLLPALGFAGGAALATLTIGMSGFGDAMSHLDDPEKFAKAIKDMAPAAREAAIAIRDLNEGAFGALRLDVQSRLFAGLAKTIKDLAAAGIPTLRDGLGGIADSMNRGVKEFAGFLTMPTTLSDISTMFGNTSFFLDRLNEAIQPFLQALTDIGVVGSAFLPGIGQWIADMAQKFADFIAKARESGQLGEWIRGGLEALGQLWTIVKNLWTSVSNLVSIFGGGEGLLGVLTALSVVLAAVTGFIAANVGWLGPLAAGILAVVVALKAWSIAQGILNAVMALNPWVIVAAAIIAVAILIATHWTEISGFLSRTWNTIWNTAKSVWNSITTAIGDAIIAVRTTVSNIVNSVVTFLSNAWNTAKTTAINAWNGLVNSVKTTVNGLLAFVRGIPGNIVSALGNLGSLLFNAGKSIIQGLINGIKSMVGSVKSAVEGVLSAARNLLPFSPAKEGPFSGKGWTLYSGRSIVDSLADGMTQRQGSLARAASSVMGAAKSQLGGALPVGLGVGAAGGQQLSAGRLRDSASATSGGTTYHIDQVNIDAKSVAEMRSVIDFFDRIQQEARRGPSRIAGVRA